MEVSFNSPDMIISKYFDDLIIELDIHVETLIQANHRDEELVAKINKLRQEFIEQIRECAEYNLEHLEGKSNLSDEDMFKKFCFFIRVESDVYRTETIHEDEYCMGYEYSLINKDGLDSLIELRLVVVDKYLTSGQIECFQEILKFSKLGDEAMRVGGSLRRRKKSLKDVFFKVDPLLMVIKNCSLSS
jgi:hypothetical protein